MPAELRQQNLGMQQRIAKLEDYMLEIAEARAELEHGRLVIHQAVINLQEQAREVPWETYLANTKKPTQAQITDAKRRAAPELVQGIEKGKWLVARIGEQIDRLENDYAIGSRVYTMMTA